MPRPPHASHGSLMMVPRPPQLGQSVMLTKLPKNELCCCRIWPVPPHAEQATGRVPFFAPLPPHASQVTSLVR